MKIQLNNNNILNFEVQTILIAIPDRQSKYLIFSFDEKA